jgi:trk system potassium uptake protein
MPFFSRINKGIIIHILGFLVMIEGLFMLTGISFSIHFYGSIDMSLLISGLISFVTGGLFWFVTRKASRVIGKREGYIIVTVSWIAISLFGSLPYLLSRTIPDLSDAFFETISGFTTTGATILTDIESMPKGLLFWRAMTHWIGGMGIIVLSVAILPLLGIGGMQLFIAEMPGITPDKLHPRITQTAKRLWGIYVLLTFIQTILLLAGGMDLFEALCHSFSTMATGGFSTRNASMAAFSPYIQYVTIVFMIMAGTSFTLHYLWLNGRLKEAWRNEEYRYYLGILLVFSCIISLLLFITSDSTPEKAFRDALFQVVSILTTTGFVTTDYLNWHGQTWILLFLLMFMGGCAGSTGGGLKIARQILLLKNSFLEFKRIIHPQAIIPVRFNGRVVSPEIIHMVMAFFLFYVLIFFACTIILSVMGLDFDTAIGVSIATLGNIGPGIGKVGPVENYSFLPDAAKWISSFMMLIGRLELFTVLILFSPTFWRK